MALDDTLLLGCAYVKEANYHEALVCFRRLMAVYEEERSSNVNVPPKLLSYFGLALALGENRINEAVIYCTKAIKKEFYHPEFYVNLARVYLKANRRSSAVNVLYKGLRIDSNDPGILSELEKLGIRRKPVLGFLHRGHVINKYLGLIMARFRAGEKETDKRASRSMIALPKYLKKK